ncbi:hypothetical protein Tb11.01.3250 [Trypanosoma brucei brucei TREU927]|uniref:Uncharacterized protein n=1 Tax=Trypanosoma brucei brucei (strain 927/4 GUTat10.1) TaxID=185431 RepID=Q383D6_TRYB2|nr:hypothetical protein Tb11.01.3250 [Trypanosoma brucei brucei TREU927]EAN80095.1 hypothetical protein Tb11.01.3250 [Trypanosoma brucei brucei TREU927]
MQFLCPFSRVNPSPFPVEGVSAADLNEAVNDHCHSRRLDERPIKGMTFAKKVGGPGRYMGKPPSTT